MKNFIDNFEEILCGAALVTMVVIVILNVFLRYLFSYAIFWAEEVATICFVWLTFVGASAVYKRKMDIGIDVLVKKTSAQTQETIRHLVNLVLLAINGYIFYMSIVFTMDAFIKPTAVLGVSSAVVNGALVVAFGLMTVHTVRFIVQDLKA